MSELDDAIARIRADGLPGMGPSQRAMVGARLAQLRVGNPQARPVEIMTVPEIAALVGVNRQTIVDAKRVLTAGTPEQIADIDAGRATVTGLADHLRQMTAPPRAGQLSAAGGNPARIERMQINGKIWADLRDALQKLAGMPLAADVVEIVRSYNPEKARLIDANLDQAYRFLEEFTDAWTKPSDQAAREARQDLRDDYPDAGNGNGVARR